MPDPRTQKLAELLVNYCVGVQPGEWVLVAGDVIAMPLIEETVRAVIKAGGHVTTHLGGGNLSYIKFTESSDEQLAWIDPIQEMAYEKVDVLIGISGSANTRALSNVDPARMQIPQRASQHLMKRFMERSAAGELRWTGTQFPCAASAQDAEMSLPEYEDFVYGATFADTDDPVKHWLEMHDMQQKIVDWLADKKEVIIRSKNAELSMSIDGRIFINSDGKKNMPSGEIFTTPVEGSVNGWINFDYPAVYAGRSVEGVRLEFKDGAVSSATAEKNEAFLRSQIELDEGAKIVGEWAIGTNYGITKHTRNILFDEKIGGTMHLALGAAYPETGGINESTLHWDMICGMQEDSEILVDGELLYKDGAFQIL